MSILGTILFFIIGMVLLIVLGAWIFVRNIMRGFRDGSGRTSNTGRAGSRNSADGSNAGGKEDAPGSIRKGRKMLVTRKSDDFFVFLLRDSSFQAGVFIRDAEER